MNLLNIEDRVRLIRDIKSTENKGRKYESLRQTEIFNDRIYQHVYERLLRRSAKSTVLEMPIVSSLNLARRVTKQEASIYKQPPTRDFSDLSDDQFAAVTRIYKDMAIDSKMLLSNESFKLQNQNHIMIVPIDGKLCLRVLRNHHLDSIDDPLNPDRPLGYVISQVEKNDVRDFNQQGVTSGRYDSWTRSTSDAVDQSIGDSDDYKKQLERYVVWTDELNFIMNGHGEIISGDDIGNPIGMVPILDVSIEKDYEYWVRQGDSITEFTIEYNALMSDVSQVVRMQGYAQAYLIAKDDVVPQNFQIGPNFLIKLPVEEGSTVRPEFGFANPGADLGGSIAFAETMLATFLTSRGLDPTTVSGKGQVNKASSGVERLLMMIEKFEASRADFDTYERAERHLYQLVKAWHNVATGTDLLDRTYQASAIPEQSELFIQYAGPELVKSEIDKVDLWSRRIEAGEATVVDMMMDLRNVDKDQAIELLKENGTIEREMLGMIGARPMEAGEEIEDEQVEADASETITVGDAAVGATNVQQQALNGAQVASLVEIVEKVAAGTLPRESAVNMIVLAFNVEQADAERLMGSAGKGFKIAVAEAPPRVPAL